MKKLDKIKIDLNEYEILLQFQSDAAPLKIQFNTPSRRFYFSLIALVAIETIKLKRPSFVYIRKHEKTLEMLDRLLAEKHSSTNIEAMWIKIRKAWRNRLPDLEGAAFFKILDRELIPPFEQGGKYRYACSEDESDIWANLFQYNESNTWKFKFAFDSISVGLDDIQVRFDDKEGTVAWKKFLESLKPSIQERKYENKIENISRSKRRYRIATLVVILVIFVLGHTAWNFFYRQPFPTVGHQIGIKPSVAVLPFVNLSDDPSKDYISDGITEEIISNLARFKDLRVISRTSAFYFKDKDLDLRAIGERLNVDHVLEGSIRISGDDIRISAQLVKVADDAHIWVENYNRQMKDIFDAQTKIAKEIVCNLSSPLGCKDAEQLYIEPKTINQEAYKYYLMGRHFWNQSTRKGNKNALSYFQKAIYEDPNFAIAYVGISDVYQQLTFSRSVSHKETYELAKKMTLKALEIDNNLAEAYASLGWLNTRLEWDWKNAEANLKKSIDLNPNYALAARYYSSYLRAIGRLEEAIEETKRGLNLDPLSTHLNRHLGIAYRFAGKIDDAIAQLEKNLELEPNNPQAMALLGNSYRDKGMYTESIAVLKKALGISPNHPFVLGNLAKAYADSGNRKGAADILNQLLVKSKQRYFSPHIIAMLYKFLGMNDKAFEWLEKAFNQKDPVMFCIKTIPDWKPFHSDPRWHALMNKMGLESYPN